MSDKSKCDRVLRLKTWMSNASFHSFNSRSDGLQCDFSTNKLKRRAVRGFLVKRDRVFLFSVIRYYKKILSVNKL